MTTHYAGPKRPRLHWPMALLAQPQPERPNSTLSIAELRHIVAERIG